MPRRTLLALLLALVPATVRAADPAPGVARDLARERARRISNVRYKLAFDLRPGAEQYAGRVEARFRLADTKGPVVLDFRDLDAKGRPIEGTVRNVTINGTALASPRQVNGHLVLPAERFRAGENTVTLEFAGGIAPSGRPVIRYLDREDSSEYLYTLFVPMDASLAFPCFDQPDLEARFTLELTAPNGWTVVANAPIDRQAPAERRGFQRTLFRETLPLSTYVFAFAAGPFAHLEGKVGVPARLYFRRTQAARARAEWPEVERLVRAGIAHLADYLGRDFPYPKYDQVLLPAFPYGGMEHAGATFLREDFILFRTLPTTNDRLLRESLLMHELAHQWFGDLVTMRWFDDLWLKEGFAELLAYRLMARQHPADAIWRRHYERHKTTAYRIDATRGTTPIHQELDNLANAKTAYGAIVYAKAPCVLRMLSLHLGEKAFRDGTRAFVRTHAHGNAEWADLIAAYEKSSGRSLKRWSAAWVKGRGMPRVEVEWGAGKDGRIDRFALRQRDVLGTDATWPIRTQVALFYPKAPAVVLPVEFDGKGVVVKEALGKLAPVVVFANHEDHAYGLFLLDARSQAGLRKHPELLTGVLQRAVLWGALWDTVREARMAPVEFLTMALDAFPRAGDGEQERWLLEQATVAWRRYLSPAQKKAVTPRFEALCRERMEKAPVVTERVLYFRALCDIATSPEARAALKAMLDGKLAIADFDLQARDRWRILTRLLAARDDEAEKRLAAEKARDKGTDARRDAYVAEAARQEAATKKRYFDGYLRDRSIPEEWVVASLGPFHAGGSALARPFGKEALAALPALDRERKIFFVLAWLEAFVKGQSSPEVLDEVRAFLKAGGLPAGLERKVLEAADELERTVRIRAGFAR